jgi:hypothetical protein
MAYTQEHVDIGVMDLKDQIVDTRIAAHFNAYAYIYHT